MDALLERLSSAQIVAVISILVGGIVALTMIVAISKYQLHALNEDSQLRREKQQAELALRERLMDRAAESGASVEALLELNPLTSEPDPQDVELAKRIGTLDAETEDIEATLKLALAANASRKKTIMAAMDELQRQGAEADAILAAIRPLCQSSIMAPARPVAAASCC